MNTYTPDAWEIVLIDSIKHGKIYKILAGWYGGYMGSDSWKLSSGIESIAIEGDVFVMPQSSGSVYELHKDTNRMSSYMGMTYARFVEVAAPEDSGFTIGIVGIDEVLRVFGRT